MRYYKKTSKDFVIFWSLHQGKPKVCRIGLSKKDNSFGAGALKSSKPPIDKLAQKLEAFLKGKDVRFDTNLLRLDLCTDFQKKVLLEIAKIPWGKVSSYRRIASCLGKPAASRAVGSALSGNPFPIILPCHRVILSSGKLGGYRGGQKMKQALLEKEAVGKSLRIKEKSH